MVDLAVPMPLKPVMPRRATRDSDVMRQIKAATDDQQAAAALKRAKSLEAAQQADRMAEEERQHELLPQTLKQKLVAPFVACFHPKRR